MGGTRTGQKPRWQWGHPQTRLVGSDGSAYRFVDLLSRVEVERLLTLGELEAVRIECGLGVAEWVDAAEAPRLWCAVQADLDDVDDWRRPCGFPGAIPYQAQLWRADDGRHVLLFTSE